MSRIELMLALTATLGTLFSIGAAIERAPSYARLMRRRWTARRARSLRRQVLSDPWSGAIVKHQRYFTTHWNAAVGRAYRAYAEARQSH